MGAYTRGRTSCGISFPSSVKSGNALYLYHFDCLRLRKTEKMEVYPCIGKAFPPYPQVIHNIRKGIPKLSTALHLHKVQDLIVSQAPLPRRAIERKTSPNMQEVT